MYFAVDFKCIIFVFDRELFVMKSLIKPFNIII